MFKVDTYIDASGQRAATSTPSAEQPSEQRAILAGEILVRAEEARRPLSDSDLIKYIEAVLSVPQQLTGPVQTALLSYALESKERIFPTVAERLVEKGAPGESLYQANMLARAIGLFLVDARTGPERAAKICFELCKFGQPEDGMHVIKHYMARAPQVGADEAAKALRALVVESTSEAIGDPNVADGLRGLACTLRFRMSLEQQCRVAAALAEHHPYHALKVLTTLSEHRKIWSAHFKAALENLLKQSGGNATALEERVKLMQRRVLSAEKPFCPELEAECRELYEKGELTSFVHRAVTSRAVFSRSFGEQILTEKEDEILSSCGATGVSFLVRLRKNLGMTERYCGLEDYLARLGTSGVEKERETRRAEILLCVLRGRLEVPNSWIADTLLHVSRLEVHLGLRLLLSAVSNDNTVPGDVRRYVLKGLARRMNPHSLLDVMDSLRKRGETLDGRDDALVIHQFIAYNRADDAIAHYGKRAFDLAPEARMALAEAFRKSGRYRQAILICEDLRKNERTPLYQHALIAHLYCLWSERSERERHAEQFQLLLAKAKSCITTPENPHYIRLACLRVFCGDVVPNTEEAQRIGLELTVAREEKRNKDSHRDIDGALRQLNALRTPNAQDLPVRG